MSPAFFQSPSASPNLHPNESNQVVRFGQIQKPCRRQVRWSSRKEVPIQQTMDYSEKSAEREMWSRLQRNDENQRTSPEGHHWNDNYELETNSRDRLRLGGDWTWLGSRWPAGVRSGLLVAGSSCVESGHGQTVWDYRTLIVKLWLISCGNYRTVIFLRKNLPRPEKNNFSFSIMMIFDHSILPTKGF